MNQSTAGRAFEVAVADAISEATGAPISQDQPYKIGKSALSSLSEKQSSMMSRAATEAAIFLVCHDKQFDCTKSIALQPDNLGKSGDVRDVVITLGKGELGISAKNNHAAVQHSRLSDRIDFGEKWGGHPVQAQYFERIGPIFARLRQMRSEGMTFAEVPNKEDAVYVPILSAFEDELTRLCDEFGGLFIPKFFSHLLGKHDFYKVTKLDSYNIVSVQSMNMQGTLGWGRRWKIPNRIEKIVRKNTRDNTPSKNTLEVYFADGWQLLFRIHSASRMVEPSLKFDIQFVGMPTSVARHEIPLD